MSPRARRGAFAAAAAAIALAAAAIAALGPSRQPSGDPASQREQRVVAPPRPEPAPHAHVPARGPAALRGARAAAARFAVAFLDRERGRLDAPIRRALRETSARRLWPRLRRPPRSTPAWRPPPARFERVSGLSEGTLPGTVEATVAFRREGRRHYLSLLMLREEGRWRAHPSGL